MKKICFVTDSFNAGGVEKSLLSILNLFNYDKYEVDLILLRKEGILLKEIPSQVNVISYSEKLSDYLGPINSALYKLSKKREYKLLFSRLKLFLSCRTWAKKSANQNSWMEIKQKIGMVKKQYDVAIAFKDGLSVYYTVEKIKAYKYIAWNHTDYNNISQLKSFDQAYFEKVNNIICVSEHCKKTLIDNFGILNNKISVIYNIISSKEIIEKSLLPMDKEGIKIDNSKNIYTLLTVGRLERQKGIDIAIEACKKLIDDGFNLKWYIIGSGSQCKKLKNKIKKLHLQDNFILLGEKDNPYPYIKKCDIYIQPSRTEGFGISVAEAKLLCKPIVVTNIPAFKEQIVHLQNGVISNTDSFSLYKNIKMLLNNEIKLITSSTYHQNEGGNLKELYKLF